MPWLYPRGRQQLHPQKTAPQMTGIPLLDTQRAPSRPLPTRQTWGGEACLLIRKHDHFTPTREIKRHVRAIARNHPEGWKLQGHVSPTTTNYLTYRIGLDDGATNLHAPPSSLSPASGASVACIDAACIWAVSFRNIPPSTTAAPAPAAAAPDRAAARRIAPRMTLP